MSRRATARSLVCLFIAFLVLGCESSPTENETASASFSPIATTETPMPGRSSTFAYFPGAWSAGPSLADNYVAFSAGDSEGRHGIYVARDEIQTIADTSTPVPGREALFTDFDHPSVGGDNTVAFVGSYGDLPPGLEPVDSTGVFLYDGDVSRTIADNSTDIPGGSGTFTGFFGANHSNESGITTFIGYGEDGQQGIYQATDDGAVSEVASSNSPVTASRSCLIIVIISDCSGDIIVIIIIFSVAQIDGEDIAFCALDESGDIGIYAVIDGELQIVADTNTLIPEGDGPFTDFNVRESIDDGAVAFIGFGDGGQAGVFLYDDGELTRIADTSTEVPAGEGTFAGFSKYNNLSMSEGRIAFPAAGEDETGGIYLWDDGDLFSVIQHGDELDGETIRLNPRSPEPEGPWWETIPPLSMAPQALRRDSLAFLVEFPDLTTAHYMATFD